MSIETLATGSTESFSRRVKRRLSSEYSTAVEARRFIRDDLAYLRDNYGLRVSMRRKTDKDKSHILMEKADFWQATQALMTLREEVSKYPREYIQNSRIDSVRLVNYLATNQQCQDGLFVQGTIYLNIGVSSERLASVIHHEMFHASDYPFDATLSLGEKLRRLITVARSVEAKAFGQEAYLGDSWRTADVDPSYASGYARKNITEDRAETAALLMHDPASARKKALENSVFRKKVQTIASDLKKRSKGKMSKAYFTDLFDGKVREGYWQ